MPVLKINRNGIETLKNSFDKGTDILANRVSDGMKFTEYQMENLRRFIKKHHHLSDITDVISKNPVKTTAGVIIAGIFLYGIMTLFKK